MTYNNTQAVNENFESIKAEGGRRTQKIAHILKSAFSEAVNEVKDGASTVSPLAKDLAGNAVQVVKQKGQEAYVNAKQAAKETATDEQDIITQFKLKLQAIVDAVKATLFGRAAAEESDVVALIKTETEVHTPEVQATEVHTVVTVDATADVA
ncbi:hypothetical protein [Leptothoe sp. PORK10 BA2]|uniref:hypothetical protein n=1 Tax=Leptothoe sp. PORK10 BA2 TaxID=3110254 RepID=UPI002B1F8047|nr:hypothetical protein [Leptothoe sp. PORK10 BA2]MEA5462271.1 hypothetical protein [Leptothoe sp. PORK10 BA2]